MKSIDAHESEATVDATGSVRVTELPFATGDRVRVLVLREARPTSALRRHSVHDIARSRAIRSGLRGATPFHYDRPDEPVGVEDWDTLRNDEAGK